MLDEHDILYTDVDELKALTADAAAAIKLINEAIELIEEHKDHVLVNDVIGWLEESARTLKSEGWEADVKAAKIEYLREIYYAEQTELAYGRPY